MTDILVDGNIISIKTNQKVVSTTYEDVLKYIDNNLSLGLNDKTIIEPTGASLSIISLSHNADSVVTAIAAGGNFAGFSGFVLSDDFKIGDSIEVYITLANPSFNAEILIYDNTSSNPVIVTADTHKLIAAKKIFSGTGNDWFTYRT